VQDILLRGNTESGGGVLGEGRESFSASCVSGESCELPAGFGAEPRSPKGFPLFSALRMASPDTTILLIVEYHAAISGHDHRAPCVRPWLTRCILSTAW